MIQAKDNWLGRRVAAYTPAELMSLFEEIYDYRRMGILIGGKLRALELEFSENVSHTSVGECMRLVEDEVLFEMSRRFCNEHEAEKAGDTNKTYYFPNSEHMDKWFVDTPVCMERAEVNRLISEWANDEVSPEDLWSQLHEATEEEISKYGTNDRK